MSDLTLDVQIYLLLNCSTIKMLHVVLWMSGLEVKVI